MKMYPPRFASIGAALLLAATSACTPPRVPPQSTSQPPPTGITGQTPQGLTEAAPPATGADSSARVRALWQQRTREGVPLDVCLGPGDSLEVTVFHWQEMSAVPVRVSGGGTITLPVVGTLQAAGKSPQQLEQDIAAKLRAGIMKEPNVRVTVTEAASQQVAVTGAVARPGLVGLTRENRTVSDLLAEAGGLANDAGGKILFYPASGDGCSSSSRRKVASLAPPADVEPIEIDSSQQGGAASVQDNPLYLPVIGGDAIVVNRGRYFVDGWVEKPGAYDISQGTTAFGALSAAGGALYPADLSGIVVWRGESNGTKKRIDVNLDKISKGEARDVTLQAGDVVSVPASAALMVPYSGYWFLTNVVRVGAGVSMTGF
jgi:polysaccharide export outer membrane protein